MLCFMKTLKSGLLFEELLHFFSLGSTLSLVQCSLLTYGTCVHLSLDILVGLGSWSGQKDNILILSGSLGSELTSHSFIITS